MKSWVVRLLTWTAWAVVIGSIVGALGGWALAQFLHLPQVEQMGQVRLAAATRVLDAEGEQLVTFAREQRIPLKPGEIPRELKLAVVAAEDGSFFEHGGVDPSAIMRAAFLSVVHGELGARGGASTITQQVARSLFLSRDRTLTRKAKEALLAIDIEGRFSKDQILAMYANLVFFGHGAYGVEAASRLYFGKPAAEMSLAECALVAAITPAPNGKFSPFRNPENALERRNTVLDEMLELGFITAEQRDEAAAAPLGAEHHRNRHALGGYFIEAVRQEIAERYGDEALYGGGLQVRTTMNRELQALAETAVREGLVALEMGLGFREPPNVVEDESAASPAEYEDPTWSELVLEPGGMAYAVVSELSRREATLLLAGRECVLTLGRSEWAESWSLERLLDVGDRVLVRLPDPLPEEPEAPLEVALLQDPDVEGSLLAMDNRTGEILAMVGGFDFGRSEFNRALQAKRQCGSAFKPFVYLTAFRQGFTPADTLLDAPFLLPDAENELTYCPKNYYPEYNGITTLRNALELSYNATAVKLQHLVGGRAVIETAREFGITTPLRPYASMALGAFEVRLVDLVRAYAGFANLGSVPRPMMIAEVTGADDRTLERAYPETRQVMPSAVTALLVRVLEGVVDRGTGMGARRLDAALAGKTGTTDNYTDAWFVGFTPRITVGVWVGREMKTPIGNKMTGATAALPIWIRFVEGYLETVPEDVRAETFPNPAGIVYASVDRLTGLRAIPECDEVILEVFLDGTEPTEECSEEWHTVIKLPWPMQLPSYTPRADEPMPDEEALRVANARLRGEDPFPEDEEGEGERAAESAG